MNFSIKDVAVNATWSILAEGLLGYAIGYLEKTSPKACASIMVISTLAKTVFFCMAALTMQKIDNIKLFTELTCVVIDHGTIIVLKHFRLISTQVALLLLIGLIVKNTFIK